MRLIFSYRKNYSAHIRHIIQHRLPDLDCPEEDCVADFNLRQRVRFTYPGACSLEYQNIIKIVISGLLQWDAKNQCAKGKGVLGTPVACAPADKE